MYRVLPVQSKVIEKKWNNIQLEHHARRMRDVKSCIDEGARGNLEAGIARKMGKHHMRNLKKEAMIEARFIEIERDNRILL